MGALGNPTALTEVEAFLIPTSEAITNLIFHTDTSTGPKWHLI